MKEFTKYLVMVCLLWMCAGCCIHQWPEEEDQGITEETRTVRLRLVYAPDFYVWEHSYDPLLGTIKESNPDAAIYPDYPGTTSRYSNIREEGLVEVHLSVMTDTRGQSRSVGDYTFIKKIDGSYDTDIDVELPADGAYRIVAWSHLLRDQSAPAYYDASDFNRVRIIDDNYEGSTDYRDGFRGTVAVDTYAESAERLDVEMRRPMAKFELVTTDLSEFLERETVRRNLPWRANSSEYTVVISFPMYFPNSYSALDDRLEGSAGGYSFRTKMTVTGDSDASLGFEYVMINNTANAGVQMRVDIYDPKGTHVAGSSTLTVPLKRDVHTLLRGAFLSNEGEGGIGLDPSFDGDHNVMWW